MSTRLETLELPGSGSNSCQDRGSIQHGYGVNEMSTTLKTSLAAAVSAALFGAAATASAAEYANVVSATPVTDSVAVPRQDCVQSERLVQAPPSGAGAVMGAIAGGVIGHQFGHGFATGLGAVAGAAIGNNVEANANPPQSVPVQHCRTVNGYESRVVGYDVVYEYHGQRYTTRLPRDPGPRLAIDIRPTGAAALDRVAPPVSYGAPAPAYAAAPAYSEPAPGYGDAPVYYDDPAPVYPARYYAPAPAYYGAPYYAPFVAPAIGLGIGYWIGSTWHRGYSYGGYHGGRRWH